MTTAAPPPARVVTVYRRQTRPFVPVDMSWIRWLKMSEALARLGYRVDIAAREPGLRGRLPRRIAPHLRRVPLASVRWDRYDVVKSLFHQGFETLEEYGGADHPCVVAKLGSVVADRDREGVYFYGEERRRLFAIQRRIAERARCVTLLTEPSRELWRACHAGTGEDLLVPGAVDAVLPPPGPRPYPAGERVCLFAGNLYDRHAQPEAHATLVESINRLGRRLAPRGIRLHVVGRGDTDRVDPACVTCHGPVPYDRSWDYLRSASVGVVLALGTFPNHNESTKIYHYLRAGLPVVCESGFPNQDLVREANLGRIIANGDPDAMAEAVEECERSDWDREGAVRWVLERHTWDARARLYDARFREWGACARTSR